MWKFADMQKYGLNDAGEKIGIQEGLEENSLQKQAEILRKMHPRHKMLIKTAA